MKMASLDSPIQSPQKNERCSWIYYASKLADRNQISIALTQSKTNEEIEWVIEFAKLNIPNEHMIVIPIKDLKIMKFTNPLNVQETKC